MKSGELHLNTNGSVVSIATSGLPIHFAYLHGRKQCYSSSCVGLGAIPRYRQVSLGDFVTIGAVFLLVKGACDRFIDE